MIKITIDIQNKIEDHNMGNLNLVLDQRGCGKTLFSKQLNAIELEPIKTTPNESNTISLNILIHKQSIGTLVVNPKEKYYEFHLNFIDVNVCRCVGYSGNFNDIDLKIGFQSRLLIDFYALGIETICNEVKK